jgi:ABC-type transport system involved in cytochrome c biogenesis ATPase subunit
VTGDPRRTPSLPAAGDSVPSPLAALLSLTSARIDDGTFTTEPLDAAGGTRLVALVGYFSPFFRLLRGEARLASGAVRLAGLDARAAVASGTVAVTSRAAPPLRTSVRHFLVMSARLSLVPRREADRRVNAALERFGLRRVADYALRDVPDGTRRVASLARASVGDASIVVMESPFAELDLTTYAVVAGAFEAIASERRVIVSFPAEPEADRGHPFVERADFAFRLAPKDRSSRA